MATTKRGFAAMDEAKRREISSKGGKASHEKGTGHEFTSEEAREAGRKGGLRGRKQSPITDQQRQDQEEPQHQDA